MAGLVVTGQLYRAAVSRTEGTLTSMGARPGMHKTAVRHLVAYLLGDGTVTEPRHPSLAKHTFKALWPQARRHAIVAIAATGNQHTRAPVVLTALVAERLQPTSAERAAGLIQVKGLIGKDDVATLALPPAARGALLTVFELRQDQRVLHITEDGQLIAGPILVTEIFAVIGDHIRLAHEDDTEYYSGPLMGLPQGSDFIVLP